jgi:hypothetical protein
MQLDAATYGSLVGVPAYNAGMVMASPRTIREYLKMSFREQPDLKHVLLALDFLQFNEMGDIADSVHKPSRMPPAFTEDELSLLFSKDGTTSSVSTLILNLKGEKPAGSTTGGPAVFDRYLKNAMAEGGNYTPFQLSEEAIGEFEATVRMCRSRGVDLKVVITPMHAEHMDALDAAGLDEDYQQWLRRVTAITPVWDFSGYNHVTTEPVLSDMKFYHDPFHYTTEVGSLMIRRVYHRPPLYQDFGTYLTPSNIEQRLSGEGQSGTLR